MIPETQTAVQLVGPEKLVLNKNKPVHEPGSNQILGLVEAVGLCFSDMKLLHAFTGHPRKTPIVEGIDPHVLKEIPSYVPKELPTVPGHEAVIIIVAVGPGVTKYKLGERYLVQTDYRHLPTAESKAAFGYNFEGALQQYVLMDDRVITAPDGESFLIPVSEEPSASAVALVEPWACVEDAYCTPERQGIKKGGKLLIVKDNNNFDLKDLISPSQSPASITAVGFHDETGLDLEESKINFVKSIDGLPNNEFYDDIIYLGCNGEIIQLLDSKLADHGLLNIATNGGKIEKPSMIDIGKVHYGGTRFIGTTSNKPSESYGNIPPKAEIPPNTDVLIVGAAGPMGTMHTIRTIYLPQKPKSVVGSDVNNDRLAMLERTVISAAEKKGIDFKTYNPKEKGNYQGKADYAVFLPPFHALLPPVLYNLRPKGILNVFAGIKIGSKAPIDMDYYVKNQIYMMGTSGSTVEDMRIVLQKVDANQLDTNTSVAAISGMKGAIEGLNGVDSQRFHGKVIVYPQLPDMDLIELEKLPDVMPDVASHLVNGVWTKEAEKALMKR